MCSRDGHEAVRRRRRGSAALGAGSWELGAAGGGRRVWARDGHAGAGRDGEGRPDSCARVPSAPARLPSSPFRARIPARPRPLPGTRCLCSEGLGDGKDFSESKVSHGGRGVVRPRRGLFRVQLLGSFRLRRRHTEGPPASPEAEAACRFTPTTASRAGSAASCQVEVGTLPFLFHETAGTVR
ncbi:uncharacterized protein [Canis lupus baileyi]|uniref:uncharacterized protein isoform X2 n=1 Tax=Canis lupus baileyi TaxID=143281 RepID=UPI003B973F61